MRICLSIYSNSSIAAFVYKSCSILDSLKAQSKDKWGLKCLLRDFLCSVLFPEMLTCHVFFMFHTVEGEGGGVRIRRVHTCIWWDICIDFASSVYSSKQSWIIKHVIAILPDYTNHEHYSLRLQHLTN